MHRPSILTGLAELSDTRMRWFSEWFDGPVTGLAEHDGHEYWFVMVTNDGGEHWDFEPRIYVLHQLTPAQLAQAWDGHRSFAALNMPGCMHSPPLPRLGHHQGRRTRCPAGAVATRIRRRLRDCACNRLVQVLERALDLRTQET